MIVTLILLATQPRDPRFIMKLHSTENLLKYFPASFFFSLFLKRKQLNLTTFSCKQSLKQTMGRAKVVPSEGVAFHLQVWTALNCDFFYYLKVHSGSWQEKGRIFAWLRCSSPPAPSSSCGHLHAKSGAKGSNKELGTIVADFFLFSILMMIMMKGILLRQARQRKCLHALAYSDICSHSL